MRAAQQEQFANDSQSENIYEKLISKKHKDQLNKQEQKQNQKQM